jgi:hypothetical protein
MKIMRKAKNITTRIALLGILALYCLLLAEIILRVLKPVPMLPRHVCATAYGIRGNEPNKRYWHRTLDCKVQFQTNSKGIRSNREIPYEKPQGIKRIVLLGDSFGMGYEVQLDEMFSARMVYYLDTGYGIKAEVVNLSTSGHGNAEELIVLENEGFKYQPDLVLLSWHFTDYQDNIRSNLYRLTTDGELVRNAETYLPGIRVNQMLCRFPGYEFIADNSQLYNFARDFIALRVKSLLVILRSIKRVGHQASTPEVIHNDLSTDLTVALLRAIQDRCEKQGVEFMVLDVPKQLSRHEFVSKFPLSQVDDAPSMHVVSPMAAFDEIKDGQLYWEHGHGHFSPLGCDVVGKELADYIVENNILGSKKSLGRP